MNSQTYANPYVVAAAEPSVRAKFIQNTYIHLSGAILVFAGLEALLLQSPFAEPLAALLMSSWWIVLILFIGASWIADRWAHSATSQGMQYLGLGTFIVVEAIIFVPMLFIAQNHFDGVITKAGFFTLLLFGALTVVAFTTKKDFSFLGGFLKIAGFVILGLIAASFIFPGGINLGTWFSVAMIVVAGASILYSTSNVMHHYRPDQHVAASLSLFASVAMMFWYILRIFMSRD
jgi:FtsH-binding integral membrane protein